MRVEKPRVRHACPFRPCLVTRTHKPVIVNPTEGELYVVPRGTYTTGVKRMNTEYKGRPETIESVFYMWRITGDRKWQVSRDYFSLFF